MAYNYSIIESLNINAPFIPNNEKFTKLASGDIGVSEKYTNGLNGVDNKVSKGVDSILNLEKTITQSIYEVIYKPLSVLSILPKTLSKVEDIISILLTVPYGEVNHPINYNKSLTYQLYGNENTNKYNKNIDEVNNISNSTNNTSNKIITDNLNISNYTIISTEYSTGVKIEGLNYKYVYKILPSIISTQNNNNLSSNNNIINAPKTIILDIMDDNGTLSEKDIPTFISKNPKYFKNYSDIIQLLYTSSDIRNNLTFKTKFELNKKNVYDNNNINEITNVIQSNISDDNINKALTNSYINRFNSIYNKKLKNKVYGSSIIKFNNTQSIIDFESDYKLQVFEVIPSTPLQLLDTVSNSGNSPYSLWYDNTNIITSKQITENDTLNNKFIIRNNSNKLYYNPINEFKIPTFNQTTFYNINDIVVYKNSYYICIKTNNTSNTITPIYPIPTDRSYWREYTFKTYYITEGILINQPKDGLNSPKLTPLNGKFDVYNRKDIFKSISKFQSLIIDIFIYLIPEFKVVLNAINNPVELIFSTIDKKLKLNFDAITDITSDINLFNDKVSSNKIKQNNNPYVRKYTNSVNGKPSHALNSFSIFNIFGLSSVILLKNGKLFLSKGDNINNSEYKYTNSMINTIINFIKVPFEFIKKIFEKIIDLFTKLNIDNIQKSITDFLSFSWLTDFLNPLNLLSIIGININFNLLKETINNPPNFIDLYRLFSFSFTDKLPIVNKATFNTLFNSGLFFKSIEGIVGFIIELINTIVTYILEIFNLPIDKLFNKIDIRKFINDILSNNTNTNTSTVNNNDVNILYKITFSDGRIINNLNIEQVYNYIKTNYNIKYDFLV